MSTESMAALNNCSHRIKRILKLYQESADRTLNGPVGNVDRVEVDSARLSRQEIQPLSNSRPSSCKVLKGGSNIGAWKRSRSSIVRNDATEAAIISTERKIDKCDIVMTALDGQKIAGFIVGGEHRLCMPHILSTVLRDFSADEVFAVCEELNVFISTCEEWQLSLLFKSGILPPSAKRCGLITFTNAERMCNVLLRHRPVYGGRVSVAGDELKIHHDCFGGCDGVFISDAYVASSSLCVQCSECGIQLSPSQFVSHSHSRLENQTFHWGFDPSNWRYYVMLSLDQNNKARAQDHLDRLKKKFENDETETKDLKKSINTESPRKKVRLNDETMDCVNNNIKDQWCPSNGMAILECNNLLQQLDINAKSPTMKLPLYLYIGAPVLKDPEQTVPYTDAQWNDRNFAPNVSLDPEPYKKLHDLYDGDDDNDGCIKSEPIDYDDDDNAFNVKTSSSKWLSSSLSSSSSSSSKSPVDATTQLNVAVGDISDDDSDETESVLSDKLPAINDNNRGTLGQISATMDARLDILMRSMKKSNGCVDPMNDFTSLQKQHLEMITDLTSTNSALFQKHRYLWSSLEEKLRASEETRRSREEELVSLKQESATKMREATMERYRLMQQIEKLSNGSIDSDWAAMATKYKEEAERLKQQLQETEDENTYLVQQITHLQKTLENSTTCGLYLPICIKTENSQKNNNNNNWYNSTSQGI